MTSEGYLLRAIGEDLYYDMTICLVASLRFHMDPRPITLLTDNPDHVLLQTYPYLFDKIIDVRPVMQEIAKIYQFTEREFKRLSTNLLWDLSPYNRTIMLDSDMLVIKETDALWNVSQNYNFTMLGCDPLYPGWGEMSDWDIEVTTKAIMQDLGESDIVRLREVHAGIIWFDKSETTGQVVNKIKEFFTYNRAERYFPKVFKMWKGQNNEMALVYAMSALNLPIIPYNKNLMSVNPKGFSVMDSLGDMGDFTQGRVYQLVGKMDFTEGTPVIVHLFKKANDPGYWKNRKELYEWLDVMMPGANLNFIG